MSSKKMKLLKNLSNPEKILLNGQIKKDEPRFIANENFGVLFSLCSKDILFFTSISYDENDLFIEGTYQFKPWAWAYLKKHPKFLK